MICYSQEGCMCVACQDDCHEAVTGHKPRHPDSQRFVDITLEDISIHDAKSADYGTADDPFANVRASEQFGVPAWVGALVRLNDKVVRLQSMVRKGYLVNEPVEDNLRDVSCYAKIALVLYEQHMASRG